MFVKGVKELKAIEVVVLAHKIYHSHLITGVGDQALVFTPPDHMLIMCVKA